MSRQRVLFDTSVVAYWLTRQERFQPNLKRVLTELRKKKAAMFISVITVQELEVFARHNGGDALDKLRTFLTTQFSTPLVFDHSCAKRAAELAARVTRRQGVTKGERREITDRWHRDAAIAATADIHGLDNLVTANVKDFEPFMEHISCELTEVFDQWVEPP